MSTRAGTMGVSARPALFTLWTAAVSVVAVTALVMSAVALNLTIRRDDPGILAEPRAASGSEISGTGPGLIHVAEGTAPETLSQIYSGSTVTGTGSGLASLAQNAERVAVLSRIYSSSGVTGTGPSLAALALNHSEPQVTGTGPGLVQVAEEAEAEG